MRRELIASIVVLSLLSLSLPAVAEDYTLPGGTYNNIGLSATLTLDVNVTLLNLAPYPKFIVVNPLYDFKVYRMGNSETMVYSNTTSGGFAHILPPDLSKNTLNYRVGFWVYPYETVKVEFSITRVHNYALPLQDYSDPCGTNVGLILLRYENGTLVSGEVGESNDLSSPTCGVIYPQLLNYPMVINFNQLLPSLDGYIKMLKYRGRVGMVIKDVPDSTDDNSTVNREFPLFFALSEPLLFQGAGEDNYTPPYSMMYSDYLNFILGYRGFSMKRTHESVKKPENSLFKLTDRLLSGGSVPSPKKPNVSAKPLDFPIWVIYMGRGVNSLSIEYDVWWDNLTG
ncbi:hypothetical protein [Thermococcus sp.]